MRKTAAQSSMSCVSVLRCSAVAAALLLLYVLAHTIQFEHQLLMALPFSSYASGVNLSSMDEISGRSRKSCDLSDPFVQLKLVQLFKAVTEGQVTH